MRMESDDVQYYYICSLRHMPRRDRVRGMAARVSLVGAASLRPLIAHVNSNLHCAVARMVCVARSDGARAAVSCTRLLARPDSSTI